ncbi:MAG TPA: DUF5694 domain-containing protein [Pyrinomonadaceae bacterium]|nr:DUF5694 domain-containing protein [Pyrinomonadaceae bacterium]
MKLRKLSYLNKAPVFIFQLILLLCCVPGKTTAQQTLQAPVLPEPKAKLLLFGTFHFKDAGTDSYRPKFDIDILSNTRQRELEMILKCLEQFAPTKVAVEVKPAEMESINKTFQQYLAGQFKLPSNEIYQIGFRMAARLKHHQLYGVDAKGRFYEPWVDPSEYAIKHKQREVLDSELVQAYDAIYKWDDELKTKQTLPAHLLYLNDEKRILKGHGRYLVETFKSGVGDEYPGVDSKTAWYNRNLRIFANIQRITEHPGERILVIIGAGHLPILRHAAMASPEYDLIEVKQYLGSSCQSKTK